RRSARWRRCGAAPPRPAAEHGQAGTADSAASPYTQPPPSPGGRPTPIVHLVKSSGQCGGAICGQRLALWTTVAGLTPGGRAAPRTGGAPDRRRPAVRPPAGSARGPAPRGPATRPAAPRPRPAPPAAAGAGRRTPAHPTAWAAPPRPPAAAAPPRAPGSSPGPPAAT